MEIIIEIKLTLEDIELAIIEYLKSKDVFKSGEVKIYHIYTAAKKFTPVVKFK